MFSRLALKLYSAVKQVIIKSNFQFWKNFASDEKQDLDNQLFGLNRDEINSGAQIISTSKIKGLRDEISNHHIS